MSIMSLTAVALGRKIKDKEVTVEEAVRAALDAVKAKEDKINAPYMKKEEREKLKDFTPSQVYKLTGNSIVVPVLEKVFYEYFKTLKDNGKLDGMDMAS